jgi:hypothetical protein
VIDGDTIQVGVRTYRLIGLVLGADLNRSESVPRSPTGLRGRQTIAAADHHTVDAHARSLRRMVKLSREEHRVRGVPGKSEREAGVQDHGREHGGGRARDSGNRGFSGSYMTAMGPGTAVSWPRISPPVKFAVWILK